MAKGRFVNQKLGKHMSRKFDLLKSELAGRASRKSSSAPDVRLPKKGASRQGPSYPVYTAGRGRH
jgi:hypothetical protein